MNPDAVESRPATERTWKPLALAIVLAIAAGACAGGEEDPATFEPVGEGANGGAAGGSDDGGDTGGTGGTGGTSSGGGSGGSGGSSGSGGTTGGSGGGGSGGAAGTGGAAGDGGTAGSGGSGGDGGSGGCDQVDWESNDSESTARQLDPITDCDDEGGTLQGTLAPGDVDWFTFDASDSALCSVNPFVDLTTSDNVTVCAFYKCNSGTTEVTCPADAEDWSTHPSHPGCCSAFTPMEPDVNCGGTLDEGVQIWIQVSWLGNTSCRPYTIEYHY